LIAAGTVAADEFRPLLIERQRIWEQTPQAVAGGMSPTEMILRERAERSAMPE
jgi:hypothetical protein